MNIHDNVMIPILITDRDGIIIYKNRAAKRCVPSPRLKANINNYIAARMKKFRVHKGDARIEFIRNSETVFNRALVFPYGKDELWCFIPELIISEPEELHRFVERIDSDSLSSLFTDISEDTDNKDKVMFGRYQRVYTDLISTMTKLNSESKIYHFPASDIITLLKKQTGELAFRHGLRMSFDIGITDLWEPYHLEFETFASVYIQLITLAFRLTDTSGCAVTAYPSKDKFVLTVTSALPRSVEYLPPVLTADVLCRMYPKETANILLLDAEARLNGYSLDTFMLDGRLALSISVPMENRNAVTLHQNLPRIITQSRFDRLEKRLYEYMEAMFLQI
ncbi:MAG: hypothetical protein IJB24_08665 [Clostridia bacterium]|nr:hypothetical protein [Clostridia bacterium]